MEAFSLYATIGIKLDDFNRGLEQAKSKLETFGKSINGISDNMSKAYSGMKDVLSPAVDGFKAVEGVGKKTGSAISKGLKGFAAAATAVGGFGAAAVKSGMDFDATMSKVSAISGAKREEFDALRAKALEMGAKTKFSASEAGEAMTYMGMAGWKAGDMISGISGIMNLAAASGEDLASTSDIVTNALTAFGLQASDSAHFADIMATAASSANTDVHMMGESFKYAAPVMGTLGYSAEDTAVALGLMGNAGIQASMAGTSLKTAMLNMTNPTKAMAGVMSKYGISLTGANGEMYSLSGVMAQLRDKMSGLDETTKAAAASTLFGKEAATGMLSIINAAPEDFNRLTSAINDCNGSAERMSKTMMDNLAGDIQYFKSAFESLQIAISDGLTPTLREFAKFGQKAMQNLLEGFQGEGTVGFMSALNGVIADGLAMLSSKAPDFARVSSMLVLTLANGILESKDKIVSATKSVINILIEPLDEWLLNEGANELASFGSEMVDTIFYGFTKAGNLVSDHIGTFIPLIAQAFLSYHEAPFTVGTDILGAIGQGIIDNKEQLQSVASETIVNMVTALRDNAPAIIEGGVALLEALVGAIVENLPLILEAGAEIVAQLVAGISGSIPAIAVVVGAITVEVLRIAKVAGDIGNAFGGLGKLIGEHCINIKGIISTIGDAFTAMGSIAMKAVTGLIGGVKMLWAAMAAHPITAIIAVIGLLVGAFVLLWNKCDGFREFWIGLWEKCKDGFGKFADWCEKSIDKLKEKTSEWREKINEKFSDIGEWFKEKWNVVKEAAVDAAQKSKEKFDELRKTIDEKFGKIADWFKEKFTAARKNVESVWSGIKDFFSKIVENIVSAFTGLPDKLKTVGSNMMQGLIGGITSKVSAVVSKVKGVVNSVKNAFTGKSGFDTHSPSRWAKRVFENVMKGGVKGLQAGTNSLSAAAMKAIGGTKDALSLDPLSVESEDGGFTDYLQSMRDKFILFLEDCQESIANFHEWLTGILTSVSESVSSIQTSFQDIWTGISETWGTAAEWFGEICENIRLVFESLTTSIVELFTAAKTSIQEVFSSLQEEFTSACEGLKEIWSKSNTFFTEIFTEAVEAVKESWSTVEEFFLEIWDAIVEIFNYAPEWFGQTFEAARMALQESFDPVLDYFTVAWDNIVSIFGNARELFSTVGANIMAGMQEGVESGRGKLLQLMDSIKQAILSIVSSLTTETQSVVSEAMQKLSETVKTEIDSMKSQVEELISRIGDALSKLESAKKKTKSLEEKAEAAEKKATGKTTQKFSNIVNASKTTARKTISSSQVDKMSAKMSKGFSGVVKSANNADSVDSSKTKRTEKYGSGNTFNFTFNSPKALDPIAAARESKKASQVMALGLV